MKVKCKQWSQRIPRPVEELWDFFSRPENLNELTPDDMEFRIESDISDQKMYPGMIVRYRVRPLLSIPVDWTTEITEIKEKEYFIDDQRVGPYALWHHQHHFQEEGEHTVMKDILHYKMGYGMIGTLLDRWIVDPKIEQIFQYRKEKIDRLFEKM